MFGLDNHKIGCLMKTSQEVIVCLDLGKGQNVKNQNVESPKKNIESQKEHQRSERRKSKRATTYGVLPMCTKACGGLFG